MTEYQKIIQEKIDDKKEHIEQLQNDIAQLKKEIFLLQKQDKQTLRKVRCNVYIGKCKRMDCSLDNISPRLLEFEPR